MLTVDRISALFVLALTLAFGVQLRGLPDLDALFPEWVLALVVVMSIGLLVTSGAGKGSRKPFKLPNMRTLGAAVGLMILWLILIPIAGFYVASVLVSTIFAAFVDSRVRKPRALAISLAVVAAEIGLFYVVFANLLDVPLPQGLLF
ncbi:MAG: tripartite tricarboxylate transporter TctB family protein [Betaproteobacteria bacterium]